MNDAQRDHCMRDERTVVAREEVAVNIRRVETNVEQDRDNQAP